MSAAHDLRQQPIVSVWCVIHHTHTGGDIVRERRASLFLGHGKRRTRDTILVFAMT
jgi:hypothetical protein